MLSRWFHYIRCGLLRLFGYETPSNYVRHGGPCLDVLKAGYLLLEFIDETRGKMLACTWEDHRHRKDLRTNLFKGLSRIMLTIAKVPVPRIGSFTLDDQGFLVLNNRPLTMEIQQLEAEKIPTNIARDTTYSSVESYVHDSLAVHDNRLDYQPNAISDRLDGISQVASLTIMKAVFTHFFARKFRRGPFVFILNDLHQGNIFVDENWNITCLIDLEWACSRPIEMLHPPHWLTTRWVDQIDLDEYTPLHQEFIKCCEEEEQQFQIEGAVSISELMNRGWDNGSFWYSLALKSPAGLYPLFYDNIRPLFTKNEDPKMVGYFASVAKHYWTPDLEDFLARKLKDKAFYDEKLREEFDVEPAP